MLESLTERVRAAVGDDCGVGKTIKLSFGDAGSIYIDGRSRPNRVDNEDRDADLTLTLSLEDFRSVLDREVKGQKVMTSGRMRVRGDMRIAMQMDKILKLD